MASDLLPECLEKVFMNLTNHSDPIFTTSIETYKIKDLYSCTLVSRYWCRISSPLLYSHSFLYFRRLIISKKSSTEKDAKNYYKLIRTLLTCIPQSEIEELVNSTINPNEPQKITPTFNYATFIRELIFDDKFLVSYGKEIWQPSYVQLTDEKLCNSVINHLMKYLCENCNNLTKLEYLHEKSHVNLMGLLVKDKLSGLKELSCTPEETFYNALSTATPNLESLHNSSKVISLEHANALSSLISSQKKLKRIVLSEDMRSSVLNDISESYNIVFSSLSTQKGWLKRLELTCLSFKDINQEALDSLCSLENLRELKLNKCKSLVADLLKDWAKSLSNLEAFEYSAFSSMYLDTDFEFILMILQYSSSALTKLVLDFKRDTDQGFKLFKDIQRYVPSLTHLELPMLFPTELNSIFKKCTELVKFSTTLAGYGQWDQNLGFAGSLVPNSVQIIQLRDMNSMHLLELRSEILEDFLKRCLNKGGKLKYLEISGKCKLNQEYFDVAKRLEVQLIKY